MVKIHLLQVLSTVPSYGKPKNTNKLIRENRKIHEVTDYCKY